MVTPDQKLTGFDLVPREYFLWIRFIGEDFYSTKSTKYVKMSTLKKN